MLKTKQLHAEESYDSLVKLSPAEERELIWWKKELQTWNGHQLLESLQKSLHWKRCIHYWLGCYPWKAKNRRLLVRIRKENAHQCVRIAESKICNPSIPRNKSSPSTHHTQDGQFNYSCIHKQDEEHVPPCSIASPKVSGCGV